MFTRIVKGADGICRGVARIVCWGTLTMALTTFAVVVLRYGFNLGWIALQEAIMYQHAFVFMLYAAYGMGQDEHVRVDVFYRRWSATRKAWVDLIGTVVFLFPICITLLVYSFDYVANSWRLFEGSTQAGGLPLVFLLKTLIPVFSILMMLQGISLLCRSALILRARSS